MQEQSSSSSTEVNTCHVRDDATAHGSTSLNSGSHPGDDRRHLSGSNVLASQPTVFSPPQKPDSEYPDFVDDSPAATQKRVSLRESAANAATSGETCAYAESSGTRTGRASGINPVRGSTDSVNARPATNSSASSGRQIPTVETQNETRRMSEQEPLSGELAIALDSNTACSTQDNSMHSSQSRSHNLTVTEHRTPDAKLSVNRFPTACTAPWNSNAEDTSACLKEELPKIDTGRKSKYDYLTEGTSLAAAGKQLKVSQNSALVQSSSRGAATRQNRPHVTADSAKEQNYTAAPDAAAYTADGAPAALFSSCGTQTEEGAVTSQERDQVTTHNDAGGDCGNSILDALRSIDFRKASQEMQQVARSNFSEQADLLKCLKFFKITARDQTTLSVQDIHALLLLCTPTGVLLQEAVDFLWDECEQRTSLPFSDFPRYGPRLRDRLLGYSRFAKQDNVSKLMETYARVFPNEPLTANNTPKARERLVRHAVENYRAGGGSRALRVYEILFLSDFSEDLYQRGVLTREEVADIMAVGNAVAGGDSCADVEKLCQASKSKAAGKSKERATQTPDANEPQQLKSHQQRNDVSGRWSDGNLGNDSHEVFPLPNPADTEEGDGEAAGSGDAVRNSRVTPRRGRTSEKKSASTKTRGKASTTGGTKNATDGAVSSGRHHRLAATTATGTCLYGDSYAQSLIPHQPSARSASKRRCPPFDLERQPKGDSVKYLGRSVEEEYEERALQDTRLIHSLEANRA